MCGYWCGHLGPIGLGSFKEPDGVHLRIVPLGRGSCRIYPPTDPVGGGWPVVALNLHHFWAVLSTG